jgi:amino acid transporter
MPHGHDLGSTRNFGQPIVGYRGRFDAERAFSFPEGAFTLSHNFFLGLGSAMLIAAYDYWGYYNVCFLGDEVKDPGKTIPRGLLLSILLVGCLYVVMNISILGVVPWQQAARSTNIAATGWPFTPYRRTSAALAIWVRRLPNAVLVIVRSPFSAHQFS